MSFSSIRFRLTAWYFLAMAATLVLFALAAWVAMKNSVLEAVDHDLRFRILDIQQFLDRQLSVGFSELLDELQEQSQLGLGGELLQLTDEDGRVLFRSSAWKELRLDRTIPAPGGTQFATLAAGGSSVRTASAMVSSKGRRFRVYVGEPLREFEESRERFEHLLLVLAPLFLLMASVGGYWISARALAPVDRITNDARLISITNLSARLRNLRSNDELQRLTHTLNEMLERIEQEVKRIVQFTADASHELRAPLTLIHTAAEFSLRRERTREELEEAMQRILRASDRTSRLVDDLLLLARADSGSDNVSLSPLDAAATVRDAAEQASTLAEAKGIQLTVDIPRQRVMVDGDERALARLWLILLDNAVKYTNQGGAVGLVMLTNGTCAEVSVSDTGAGIASEDLPFVFDRFWRADKVRSRALGGAGLGLSIGRWIANLHGGDIIVNSEAGKGTRVIVRLPLVVESSQPIGPREN